MSFLLVAAPEVVPEEAVDSTHQHDHDDQSAFPRTLMVTSFFAGIVAGVILCRLFSTIHIPAQRKSKGQDTPERKKSDARNWSRGSIHSFVSAQSSVQGPRLKTFGERKMESLGLSWKNSAAGGSVNSSNSYGYNSAHGSRSQRRSKIGMDSEGSQDIGSGRASSESDTENSSYGNGPKPHADLKVSNRSNWSASMSERLFATADLGAGTDLPEPEHHFVATCLFFDIIEFSKQCAERTSEQVRDWMLEVHTTVEDLTEKHAIRVVECRGDCYICISGTSYTEEDLWETQMMRMINFGCDVHNQLIGGEHKTRIRIGIAVGPLTIGFIRGGEGGLNLVAYGDTINTAARMEQNGKEGMVLMTKAAAHRLCREAIDKDLPYSHNEIPVNVTFIKSKGLFPTVWFDCWTRNFMKAPRKVVDAQNRALRLSWPAGREIEDRMDGQEWLCSYQAL